MRGRPCRLSSMQLPDAGIYDKDVYGRRGVKGLARQLAGRKSQWGGRRQPHSCLFDDVIIDLTWVEAARCLASSTLPEEAGLGVGCGLRMDDALDQPS